MQVLFLSLFCLLLVLAVWLLLGDVKVETQRRKNVVQCGRTMRLAEIIEHQVPGDFIVEKTGVIGLGTAIWFSPLERNQTARDTYFQPEFDEDVFLIQSVALKQIQGMVSRSMIWRVRYISRDNSVIDSLG